MYIPSIFHPISIKMVNRISNVNSDSEPNSFRRNTICSDNGFSPHSKRKPEDKWKTEMGKREIKVWDRQERTKDKSGVQRWKDHVWINLRSGANEGGDDILDIPPPGRTHLAHYSLDRQLTVFGVGLGCIDCHHCPAKRRRSIRATFFADDNPRYFFCVRPVKNEVFWFEDTVQVVMTNGRKLRCS